MEPKKLNVIILALNPLTKPDHPSKIGYKNLEEAIKENESEEYNTLIIRHEELEDKNRNVNLFKADRDLENHGIIKWVKGFGENKFTDSANLSPIFNYINQQFPSKESILIIFGHGFAVGFFNRWGR